MRRNPWTPPSQLWPSYEYRVRRAPGRHGSRSYEVWRIEKRYGETPRMLRVSQDHELDIEALRSAESHAQRQSASAPRNPNAVIVLNMFGTCYTSYRAGQEVGCTNPTPIYEYKTVPMRRASQIFIASKGRKYNIMSHEWLILERSPQGQIQAVYWEESKVHALSAARSFAIEAVRKKAADSVMARVLDEQGICTAAYGLDLNARVVEMPCS